MDVDNMYIRECVFVCVKEKEIDCSVIVIAILYVILIKIYMNAFTTKVFPENFQ